MEQSIAFYRMTDSGIRGRAMDDFSLFLLDKLLHLTAHGEQPLLVWALGEKGVLADFIVELTESFTGNADELRAFTGLLELLHESAAQKRDLFAQRLALLRRELQWVTVFGILRPPSVEGNRP
ncbi:MAG: hypothetical protein ACKOUR_16330 [Planctomycetota bacterium]